MQALHEQMDYEIRDDNWKELQAFINTYPNVGYDAEKKSAFYTQGLLAMKELKTLLQDLGVTKLNIDYNKGGIAVSGDFHLRGDLHAGTSFDFFFNLDMSMNSFCYRKTKSQTDYAGGTNRYFNFNTNIREAAERIIMLSSSHEAL